MVSAGDTGLGLLRHEQPATHPLLATSAILHTALFPVHKFKPRDGLTMDRHKFQRDVLALLAAFSLPPEAVKSAPAIHVSPSSASRNATGGAAGGGGERPLQAQQDALASWQRVNTASYRHLLPAVDVDGPHYIEDTAIFDSFGLWHSGSWSQAAPMGA